DLPPDHPGRAAAETQAGDLGGTTPGHREGGAAPLGEESEEALVDQRFEKDSAKVRRK
ncbi:MAG: hypothetical protein JWP17_4042, partial [Solirubrobacterales bacterium]|nr:hypothetical protein [Solirubrobacterales bacterium]